MQKLLGQFKNQSIFKYLLSTILIIVPLYPKFPLFAISGTYVAIRFEDLILLVLALVTFTKIITNFKQFWSDKLYRSFLIFFFVGFVSLVSGVYVTKTVDMHIGILHLLRRVEYTVPFFAILLLFKKDFLSKNINYYLWTLVIVTVVTFIYGVGQKYYSFPIIITQNQEYSKGVALRYTEGSHINSTFAGHYDLAAFMVLIMPTLIALLFIYKDKLSRIILSMSILMCMWLLVNSLSRIAQVSYLLSTSIALLLIKKYKELAMVLAISLVFILSSSGLYQRFSRFFNVYAADNVVVPVATPIEVYEDRSTNIRLAVEWPRAVRAFVKNPILGTGYSSISLATDNDFLRMLGETGVLGFLAFVLIFVNLFKEIKKGFQVMKKFSELELALFVGVFGSIFGTLLTATFIDIFEASKFATMFWMFIGFIVLIIRNKLNDQEN